MIKTITVVGGGNGGHAAAADLALRGYGTRLYEHEAFESAIAATQQQRGVVAEGVISGFASLELITTDAEQAVTGSDLLIVIAPAFAAESLADELIPHLAEGQIVLFNPGAMGSSVRFRQQLAARRPDSPAISVGETASLTYAARMVRPGAVRVTLITKDILFAAYPSIETPQLLGSLQALFPGLIQGRHVFDTGLNNGNPISHPTATLLNAGRIESDGESFYLYRDGMTPRVVDVMQQLDEERLRLCHALGVTIMPVEERIVRFGYAKRAASLHVSYSTSEIYNAAAGPSTLEHRYLTEDVPYGLVPWASLAHQLGIDVPIMDAEITLAGALAREDYRQSGVSMAKMGLDTFDAAAIAAVLEDGSSRSS